MEATTNNFERTRIRSLGYGLLVLLASLGAALLIIELILRSLLARGNRYVLMCVPSILRFNFGIDHENLLCNDLEEFALEHSIDYVDLRPEFERSEPGNPFFETDLHFNGTGHRLVYEALLQAAPNFGVLRRPSGQRAESR